MTMDTTFYRTNHLTLYPHIKINMDTDDTYFMGLLLNVRKILQTMITI